MNKLPVGWSEFLLKQPETGMDYQIVAVALVDGRTFDLAIIHCSIVGEVRGYDNIPFDPAEITAIVVTHQKWQFRK